jgi:hypothetical protein
MQWLVFSGQCLKGQIFGRDVLHNTVPPFDREMKGIMPVFAFAS